MAYSNYAIIVTKLNGRLVRRKKAFETWVRGSKSPIDKSNPILSPAKKRAFLKRMARAKRNGVLHEIKMYIVALAIVIACYAIYLLL